METIYKREYSSMLVHTSFLDIVSKVKVELFHRHRYVSRLDTEDWIGALVSLHQPLSICAFQWDSFKQDDHHQVQPPHLENDTYYVEPLQTCTTSYA